MSKIVEHVVKSNIKGWPTGKKDKDGKAEAVDLKPGDTVSIDTEDETQAQYIREGVLERVQTAAEVKAEAKAAK